MNVTDACVFPIPHGDSSARRLAADARALGFDSMILPGHPGFSSGDFRAIRGKILRCRNASQLSAAIRKTEQDTVVLVEAGDNSFNRAALSMRGVHVLRNIQATDKRAFDHVAARIASGRPVGIDIDLYPVIHLRGAQRQRVLERYRDIVRLQKRFGFMVTLSSGAVSVLDLRSPDELAALCTLFGMEWEAAVAALASIGRIIAPPSAVVVVQ